jgi:hypothetical protein
MGRVKAAAGVASAADLRADLPRVGPPSSAVGVHATARAIAPSIKASVRVMDLLGWRACIA